MKILINPPKLEWQRLCERAAVNVLMLEEKVNTILTEVQAKGDVALKKFTLAFDAVQISDLKVSEFEIRDAEDKISIALKNAIALAAKNIKVFHQSQILNETVVETMPGVNCWRKAVPIEKIGFYIPGGTAPLFSSILMLGIPAILAGCKNMVLCTPANSSGIIHPAILYTANFLGIKNIYKVGGAQAIAAMAFGTETIPKQDKIFGPGNQYVTKAKEMVQKYGVAIDLPAGPSELLIIADENAEADFIAADLLSQAEHGADSQVILLCTTKTILEKVQAAVKTQWANLERKELAEKALANSRFILFNTLQDCMEFSNAYAPEHLILAIENPSILVDSIKNAGSVFLGKYTPESAGDYASGTNHTLPTNGYAKTMSGVSLDSFYKKITFQEISKSGLQNIGAIIEIMAATESLTAHKNAVSIRLKSILNEQ